MDEQYPECPECPLYSVDTECFIEIMALMVSIYEIVECPIEACAEIAHTWIHHRMAPSDPKQDKDILRQFQDEIAVKPLGQALYEMAAGAKLSVEQRTADKERQAEAARSGPSERFNQ